MKLRKYDQKLEKSHNMEFINYFGYILQLATQFCNSFFIIIAKTLFLMYLPKIP